jgi:hypothetical protein
MGVASSAYGSERRGIEGLVGEAEGKGSFGRPRHRWEDNILWIFRKCDSEI